MRPVAALVTSIKKVILAMIDNLQKRNKKETLCRVRNLKSGMGLHSDSDRIGGLVLSSTYVPCLGRQIRVAQKDDGRRGMRRGGQRAPFRRATSSASERVFGRRRGIAPASQSHPPASLRTMRARARARGGRASTRRSPSWRWDWRQL